MGGQKGIAFFYNFFSKKANLTIITTKDNDAVYAKGYTLLNILSTSKLRYINLFYFFRIRRIIKQKQITHLIIEHPYYGWLGILLKWFCKVKLIVHSHNIEALRFKSINKWWWSILWNYEKFTYKNANINFFITDEDKAFAIKKFNLKPANCHTITYGIEINEIPLPKQRQEAKETLQKLYQINVADKILLFNGTLDYKPNLDALDAILQNINPLLLSQEFFAYKIIICGKALPAHYNNLKDYISKNIIYAGFVDDINIYFKGADIFINPVIDGGGIKTKLVEALGNNLSSVSTQSGATGIPNAVTGNKMCIADGWPNFANAILQANTKETIPAAFFDYFYWDNIAAKAKLIIN